MKIFCSISLLISCCVSFKTFSQTTQEKVKQFVQSNKNRMIDEYTGFVSIRDVSGDSENIPLNTAFIQKMMEQRGIKTELLHGTTAGVNAAVYGEIKVAGAKRTIAFPAVVGRRPTMEKTRWIKWNQS